MKKKLLSITLVIALLSSMCSFNAFANQIVSVYLDNQPLQFDVPPQIINGRTMVPLRAIFEKLGATVEWDETTQTCIATTESYRGIEGMIATITIQIDNKTGTLKGRYSESLKKTLIEQYGETLESLEQEENEVETFEMDVAPRIVGVRTLVPLRAISEAFACDVQWVGETSTVNIYSNNLSGFDTSAELQEEVRVSTAEQLLNSIGSNKKIILTSDYYNLSSVKSTNNEYVEKQLNWDDTFLNAYVIKNVVNMTIEGNAEIVIDDIYADVLMLENCEGITLSGLTVGHTEYFDEYQCEGAVTTFDNCQSITIENCNLYGCGAVGVRSIDTSDILVDNTNIYDCSYCAVTFSNSKNATVNECNMYNSTYFGGVCQISSSNVKFNKCVVRDNSTNGWEGFIVIDDWNGPNSTVAWNGCKFANNVFDVIANPEAKELTFNNCTFENNTGDMNHPGVVYNNSVGFDSTNNQAQTSSSMPGEKDYTDFVCDYLNGINDSGELYFSYSLEKHAYQMHIGSNYIDVFKQLYGFDENSRNRVLKEAIYPIFDAADNICSSMVDNFEYKYSDEMVLEVLDPIDSKVIYISKNGQKFYSYFDQETTTSGSQSTQTSGIKSTAEEQILFLKFVKVAINSQGNATNNLTYHVRYDFDERYKTLFFDNLNTAYMAVTSAHEMCLTYSDMNNLAEPLKNILRVYDDIFAGKYSLLTMDGALTETLEYYKMISDMTDLWLTK